LHLGRRDEAYTVLWQPLEVKGYEYDGNRVENGIINKYWKSKCNMEINKITR
jgi:hypothetical protein